ncbi:uncharacterized protein PAC_06541 [Phialocephala subalpina]|uniref:2EXR domain-containing protein n=1 Tax=Phialocephala subalpina TaxID=576137 RepID=A0A1L7WV48_9HELO|nr:uncharacterized protein PAC_06541 [Phialocephala subalpina]
MKIIDESVSMQDKEARARKQEAALVLEFRHIRTQFPLQLLYPDENVEETEEYKTLMAIKDEDLFREQLDHCLMSCLQRKIVELARPPSPPPSPTFTCFPQLPTELRLKIWEYALEPHGRERVHCIDISDSNKNNWGKIMTGPDPDSKLTFVSNQPIHGAVYACHESRNLYLSLTGAEFSPALRTYINFDTDIIYVPNLEITPLTIWSFLFGDAGCSKDIQRLAMPKSLYCELPSRTEGEHFSTHHVRLRGQMPKWRETLIVFEDDSFEEIWGAQEGRFVDLTARQKRKKAERGYARQYTQTLNNMVEAVGGLKPMDYRFVVYKP